MISLKAYIPVLARQLESSPAALYERQRALVRAGLLDTGDGRGPGSGVRATPKAVAHLLIAVLAAEDLKDVEERARATAGALFLDGGKCPITKARRFDDALAWVLRSRENSEKIHDVDVSRRSIFATIGVRDGAKIKGYMFVGTSGSYGSFRVLATLDAPIIRQIAQDLAADAETAAHSDEKRGAK